MKGYGVGLCAKYDLAYEVNCLELTAAQLEGFLSLYRQLEVEMRVKLEQLRGPLESKFGRPVILFVESRIIFPRLSEMNFMNRSLWPTDVCLRTE